MLSALIHALMLIIRAVQESVSPFEIMLEAKTSDLIHFLLRCAGKLTLAQNFLNFLLFRQITNVVENVR